MTDKQQHEEILEQLEALYEAYSKEVAKAFEKNGYDELTTKQQEELKKININLINSMNEGICNDAC